MNASFPHPLENGIGGLLRRVAIGDKDQRVFACSELQQAIINARDVKGLGREPFSVLRALEEQFFNRQSFEFKREIAKCVGSVGYIMGLKLNDYFVWLIESYEKCSANDLKGLYMEALSATYKCESGRRKLEKLTEKMLNDLQKYLENSESSDILLPIIDTITTISTTYPDLFDSHFKDIVDILMGWYIDPEQTEKFLDEVDRGLSKLQPFWLQDMNFTFTLMSQFLEDAEKDAQDLNLITSKTDFNISTLETNVIKISYLIRAFRSILNIVAGFFIVNPEDTRAKTFASDTLSKLLFCVQACSNRFILKSDAVIVQTLQATKVLLYIYRSHTELLFDTLIDGCRLISKFETLSDKAVSRLIVVLEKVITYSPADTLANYVGHLINPRDGLFFVYRNHRDSQVFELIMGAYKTLLTPKSVKCLQQSYTFVTSELRYCFEVLFNEIKHDYPSKTLDQWEGVEAIVISSDLQYSSDRAEFTIVYLCSTLEGLVNAKNSLIGMWALVPNLFTLLSSLMPTVEPWFYSNYNGAAYSVLFILKMYCECHDNFINNSEILQGQTPNLMYSNQTKKYFTTVLDILGKLLSANLCPLDIISLCLQWFEKIIDSSRKINNELIFKDKSIIEVFESVLTVADEIITAVSFDYQSCCKKLIEAAMGFLSIDFMKKAVVKFGNLFEQTLDKSWITLMNMFDEELCLNTRLSSLQSAEEPNIEILSTKSTMNFLSGETNFNSGQFRKIMDFLLYGADLDEENHHETLSRDFLELAFYSAKGTNVDENISKKFRPLSMLYYWAVWDAAQFCILNRLKTPFGKPQDTFLTIEAALKTLASYSHIKTLSTSSSSINKEKFEEEDAERGFYNNSENYGNQSFSPKVSNRVLIRSSQDWFRVRWLLVFMECLEKQMYNAYEGTAFVLPSLAKPVKGFFRTNKSTCKEWLNRIRFALIEVASKNGYNTLVIRIAGQLFYEVEFGGCKNADNIEQILVFTTKSLIEMKDEAALQGLHCKATKLFGLKSEWIKVCAIMAADRYEEAASKFSELILKNDANQTPDQEDELKLENDKKQKALMSPVLSFCHEQLLKCYAKCFDYQSIDNCLIMESMKLHCCSSESSAEKYYAKMVDIYREMTNFENSNTNTINSALKEENALKSRLSPVERSVNANLMWSYADLIERTETKIYSLLKNFKEKRSDSDSLSLSRFKSDLESIQRVFLCSTGPYKMDKRIQFLGFCLQKSFNINSNGGKTKWVSFMNNFNQKTTLDYDSLNELHFVMAGQKNLACQHGDLDLCRLAARQSRKLGNHKLALRQLSIHALHSIPNLLVDQISNFNAVDLMRKISSLDLNEGGNSGASRLALCADLAKVAFACSTENKICGKGAENCGKVAVFGTLVNAVATMLDRTFGSAVNAVVLQQQQQLESFDQPNPPLNVSYSSVVAQLFYALASSTKANGIASPSSSSLNSWSSSSFNKSSSQSTTQNPLSYADAVNRCLLLLARWLPSQMEFGAQILSVNEDSLFIKLLEEQMEAVYTTLDVEGTERVVGAVLTLTRKFSPSCMKSQLKFADWAYRTARSMLLRGNDGKRHIKLPLEDQLFIKRTIPQALDESKFESIVGILNRLRSDDQKMISETEMTNELEALLTTPENGYNHPNQLVSIWQRLNAEIFRFYNAAAQTYFQYLNLNAEVSTSTINACLRLLNLLTKHYNDLTPTIEAGFPLIRAVHWTRLIPQLIARLQHKNLAVRKILCKILCDVAQLHPELVLYQAIIGAGNTNRSNQEMLLSQCYELVLKSIDQKCDRMVPEAKIFVKELQRITLLREEVWFTALTYTQHEVKKRLQQCKHDEEARKTLMKMIFSSMTELYKITSHKPETDNDQFFCKHIQPLIETALKGDGDSSTNPETAWEPFNNLLEMLTNRANRKSNWLLQMKDISPVLKEMKSTRIPMPGVARGGQCVFVEGVGPEVTILPTKTRPKKIWLLGSDGKTYAYLCKGSEDLRLDERVMQFLTMCNVIFKEKSQNKHLTRHYAVTPLGPRCGLIQWVENATPLFTIYKRWLMREASLNGRPNVPRPSEIFYAKITPLLEKRNVKDLENRSKWPASVLKEALTQLINETPRDLLAKELWCLSMNADMWWASCENFSISTALMSMIGFVIGLGDRHLDNILVNFETGHVVHIDYNVCFEKGKHLRVPETVPFRLTPNIQAALGVTGVEGKFRHTCETVLNLLSENRELLFSLLQTFVYDPLVDWTLKKTDGFHWQNHKMYEMYSAGDEETVHDVLELDSSDIVSQAKNPQGFSVRQRVKAKLEKPNKDQVDTIIRESIDIDRLSQLYEGWTAWV